MSKTATTKCILWVRPYSIQKGGRLKGLKVVDTYEGTKLTEVLAMAQAHNVTTVAVVYEDLEGAGLFKELHKMTPLANLAPDIKVVLRINANVEVTIDSSNYSLFQLCWFHYLKALSNGLNNDLTVMDMLKAM